MNKINIVNNRFYRYKLTLALWLIPAIVISIRTFLDPFHRSVTSTYFEAAAHWATSQDLYNLTSISAGYHYLPHFAILFYPFYKLGVFGDVLWRWVGLGLVAIVLLSANKQLTDRQAAPKHLAKMSLIVVPILLGAMSKGQANLHLGGCFVLTLYLLSNKRYWYAAAALWLAMIIKPLALFPIFFVLILFPQCFIPLVAGLPVFFIIPYLRFDWSYVTHQMVDCFKKLSYDTSNEEFRFADIYGFLRILGIEISSHTFRFFRLAAFFLLSFTTWNLPLSQDNYTRSLFWFGISVTTLLLLNPMTESNSYCMLAPFLGLFYIHLIKVKQVNAASLIFWMALSLSFLPLLLRHIWGNYFDLFWDPFICLIVLVMIFRTTSFKNEEVETGIS